MATAFGSSVSQSPVTVSLSDLENGSVSLTSLEAAFGPDSLGIIVVQDLPGKYVDLRRRLLSYSSYLANLPQEELDKLEHPTAKYLTGWSLGKEKLKGNKPDTLKGSYYVNCAFHHDPSLSGAPTTSPPTASGAQKDFSDFPEYTAPNAWPEESILPGFRKTCEELCSLVIETAALVARACDRFAEVNVEGYERGYLEKVVSGSMTTKARLLHYFPPPENSSNGVNEDGGEEEEEDDWCATHLDHGCLTGLTSAMYIDEAVHSPNLPPSTSNNSANGSTISLRPLPELPSAPDTRAGLYIHSRSGTITKVSIPCDCLAFQTGEALEVITKGKFRAVPHFVRGAQGGKGGSVARNTLAVFTQPNLWEMVDREKRVDFARFARGVVEKNY